MTVRDLASTTSSLSKEPRSPSLSRRDSLASSFASTLRTGYFGAGSPLNQLSPRAAGRDALMEEEVNTASPHFPLTRRKKAPISREDRWNTSIASTTFGGGTSRTFSPMLRQDSLASLNMTQCSLGEGRLCPSPEICPPSENEDEAEGGSQRQRIRTEEAVLSELLGEVAMQRMASGDSDELESQRLRSCSPQRQTPSLCSSPSASGRVWSQGFGRRTESSSVWSPTSTVLRGGCNSAASPLAMEPQMAPQTRMRSPRLSTTPRYNSPELAEAEMDSEGQRRLSSTGRDSHNTQLRHSADGRLTTNVMPASARTSTRRSDRWSCGPRASSPARPSSLISSPMKVAGGGRFSEPRALSRSPPRRHRQTVGPHEVFADRGMSHARDEVEEMARRSGWIDMTASPHTTTSSSVEEPFGRPSEFAATYEEVDDEPQVDAKAALTSQLEAECADADAMREAKQRAAQRRAVMYSQCQRDRAAAK